MAIVRFEPTECCIRFVVTPVPPAFAFLNIVQDFEGVSHASRGVRRIFAYDSAGR
jgi:hypothetical protein